MLPKNFWMIETNFLYNITRKVILFLTAVAFVRPNHKTK